MDKLKKIQFDRTIPYNTLPELPIDEQYIDIEVLKKWGIASRALAELNKNILRIPNPTMLVNTISLQEAQSSTAIENIFTTEDELYKAVSDSIKEETANLATKEVLRYRQALWGGYQKLKENNYFDESIFIQVFQEIKDTKQTFRSPQSQTVIKRGNSDLRPGETIYTPPRGEGIIEEKIKNLVHFLNNNEEFDPLIKMAIAHYQFEAIHPFIDGNGRTGRILNLLYLVDQKLLSHPVLYLSQYIIQNKDDYYYLLSGVTQRNAWKPWLIYMLDAVEKTAKNTNQKIDDILNQMEATYQYAKPKFKWYTHEFNLVLFSQPYIRQRLISKVLSINSRTTIVKYMHELTQAGIVSQREDGREIFYLNDDLLKILQS